MQARHVPERFLYLTRSECAADHIYPPITDNTSLHLNDGTQLPRPGMPMTTRPKNSTTYIVEDIRVSSVEVSVACFIHWHNFHFLYTITPRMAQNVRCVYVQKSGACQPPHLDSEDFQLCAALHGLERRIHSSGHRSPTYTNQEETELRCASGVSSPNRIFGHLNRSGDEGSKTRAKIFQKACAYLVSRAIRTAFQHLSTALLEISVRSNLSELLRSVCYSALSSP